MLRSPVSLLAAILVLVPFSCGDLPQVWAQANGGNGFNAAGGITIDPNGVVEPVVTKGRSEKLDKKRMAELAGRLLDADLNKSSSFRKVSLVELERVCAPYGEKPETIPPAIFHLAGLQRIDYVFVYPEERDIIIAGPAEGFAPNSLGRVVGVMSGRPTLRLDDLVMALRALKGPGLVGCSIDSIPENLAALQRYIAANSSPTSPTEAAARYDEMAKVLGMQTVKVWGVPGDSHFARTLVEADYRMKRISIALEASGVRSLKSHLSMLAPQGNSMQRWWMAPLYDAILTTSDRNAYQIDGQRVKMLSQEEVADAGGNRSDAAHTRLSTQKYAQHFTEKFPELAAASPVFAELQNLFDLLIVAALFQKEGLPQKVGWKMTAFLDERAMTFPKSNVPKQVASVANHRRATNGFLLGLVGGGVLIRPMDTIDQTEFKLTNQPTLTKTHDAAAPQPVANHRRWWWD